MLTKDLRYATRALARSPGFTVTAVVTIALGIGVSTAIFSVVNAVLLRPLPYSDPDRLVLIWGDMRNRGVTDFPFPPADFQDLRDQGTLFDGFAAVNTFRQSISGDDNEPQEVRAAAVTTNFFSLLGANVQLGRDFIEADGTLPPRPPAQPVAAANPQPANQRGQPAARGNTAAAAAPANAPAPNAQQAQPRLPAMAVLSSGFWQRRYGSDPNVLGRRIEIGGNSAEIVGVLAPGFELLFPPNTSIERSPDIWTALRVDFAAGSRTNVFLRVIGRVRKGVTLEQAQQQIDVMTEDLRKRFPIKETSGLYLRVESMNKDLVADVKPSILALLGAGIFVLLIACANVANLLLVRVSWRQRELAVRAALGANQWRLVRQMLFESLLVAGGGALLGLLLALYGIGLLMKLGPEGLPRIESVKVDGFVLAFSLAAALVAALVFGVFPAFRAARPDLMELLRASNRTAALKSGRLLRKSVVILEVALSFMLLIGSGLLFRSFLALQHTNPGYDHEGVLTFFLPNIRAQGADARAAFMRQMRDRLASLPGVESVGAASPFPLDGTVANARWGTEAAISDPNKFQQANVHFVMPGYFETVRARLIEGRTFADADNGTDIRMIVIDNRLAAKAFPGESAVGKHLFARIRTNEPETFEVIGVVAHQRHTSLASDGREEIFFGDSLVGPGAANRWAVRTSGDPSALVPAIREEIARIDPRLAVSQIQPMQRFVELAQSSTRFALVLIGVFAAIALLLAVVGLYGVLSTVVRQRTTEIGVRMAFGAPQTSIFRLVLGEGLLLSGAGIGIGLGGAFAVTRVIESMLVGVKPVDPATFGAIAVLFFVVAAFACWRPAWRAARLDPTVALREE
ncbi:MAG TPA: ABC transporter permease [Blastocatellia bacterium]|nr:ABC transporter permease [Blastocatellia bacterium]